MIKEAGCYNIAGKKTGVIFSPELVEVVLEDVSVFVKEGKIVIRTNDGVFRTIAIKENIR